jgi:hypothetical protein
MPRYLDYFERPEPLVLNDAQVVSLKQWLMDEVEAAVSARMEQERVWRDVLRMYEGVPKTEVRNVPIENAPNIEVTLGAIASDAIYAQAVDTLFNISPLITVRATDRMNVPSAKAMQRWANWVADNQSKLRPAAESTVLDTVQLGTGVYYIPWVEWTKKTRIARVLSRGPVIFSIPPEDVFVPGGANVDVQTAQWVGVRFWLSEGEFASRAKRHEWNTDGVMPAGTVGWVRSHREMLGRTSSSRTIGFNYETFDIYALFDIDDDGEEEDLLIHWDRSSHNIMGVWYNPFDNRPLEPMRYQLRPHLFYGIGVIEMVKPFEEEATEIHNYRMLNMLLANCRFWKGRTGTTADGELRIWPGKYLEMQDPEDLKGEAMAEVYPSIFQSESIPIALAERRTGVNEMSYPRPSQVLGSRTPGITALSMIQMTNRRFTPAFDQIRIGSAKAIIQCMYRYQERLLANDTRVEENIRSVLGTRDGALVINALKRPDFDEAVAIEMTASGATTNRDADRQNAIMLVNILSSYYQKTLELVMIASNPQTPPEVRDVATKISGAASEIIERTIRTFDQVRDPQTFIIDVEREIDALPGLDQEGVSGLTGLVSRFAQMTAGEGNGGAMGGVPQPG